MQRKCGDPSNRRIASLVALLVCVATSIVFAQAPPPNINEILDDILQVAEKERYVMSRAVRACENDMGRVRYRYRLVVDLAKNPQPSDAPNSPYQRVRREARASVRSCSCVKQLVDGASPGGWRTLIDYLKLDGVC